VLIGFAAISCPCLVLAVPRNRSATAAWIACVAAAGVAGGAGIGTVRLAAIDGGALLAPVGADVTIRGYVASFAHHSQGHVDVVVATPEGRLVLETPEPAPELEMGTGVEASGTIRAPPDWQRDYYERLGVERILVSSQPRPLGRRRKGLAGAVDGVRQRSEEALTMGTTEPAANLLRGFVLGEDDRIDDATRDRFKRSGLAHLLAVSGQNVVLLAILGAAICAALGVSLRGRLVAVLALVVLYVPLTGAGASIQRAGIMGAAGVVAAMAGRPTSRWYALLLAAAATLAINPRAEGDIGWQLSFAAVLGILCFCAPLSRLLAGPRPRRLRRALGEAAALTISATLATAPLTAFHFETLSLVALPANLLAVPAEAPVMWAGMLAAAAGQVSALAASPLSWLAGLLAGYVDQVAAWTAGPSWAQINLGVGGLAVLAAVYATLGVTLLVGLRSAARRAGMRPASTLPGPRHRPRTRWLALALALLAFLVAGVALLGTGRAPPPRHGQLRVDVLDVGQGDAILLRPARAPAVLVDAGPPGSDVAGDLDRLGVHELGALVLTHPDLDHVGGVPALVARVQPDRVLYARVDRTSRAAATNSGADLERVEGGDVVRSGNLRLDVLWPPPSRMGLGPPAVTNELAVVLLAKWPGFRMLLTADAEAELAPVNPGDIDVLKVAHHGSDDAGLDALLARARPELAVISVGADNPFGHPTPATLASLADAGVPVLRTDRDGEIEISATAGGWWVTER
jgi:competence protein ComEC